MIKRFFFLIAFISTTISCQNKEVQNPLEQALRSQHIKIRQVVDSIDNYEVQIQLTTIKRNTNNVTFHDYSFRVDDSVYFYPASSVKFPIAVLALEKLEKEQLRRDTRFFVEGDSVETTFANEITKIFAVSDNDAYNRLFDYLGTDYINNTLKSKGVDPVRISHRLSVDDADNVETKPLILFINDSTYTTTKTMYNSPVEKLNLKKIEKGSGYYQDGILINEPMDFSYKNYLPISALHQLMKRIIFPEKFQSKETFNLSQNNYQFLLSAMSILPKNAGYSVDEFYDGYVKFFLFGDTKETIPDHLKIYNKVGYAYGYLTDCAYIKDTKNDVEFILTATIHVNKNGIFNDDTYEYEEIGIPFLAELGRQIHANLLKNN